MVFQRQATESAKPAGAGNAAADSVQTARRRARQRLIGAVVLLMIGVIGFPLIFESQPRPLPVDIAIEIPRKEAAPALVLPSARVAAAKPPAAVVPPVAVLSQTPAPLAKAASETITEGRADAGREIAAPADKSAAAAASALGPRGAAAAISAEPAKALAPKTADKPQPVAASPAAPADGARAQALLDGKPAASNPGADAGARFIVQIGAFGDPNVARETRLKVERLGLTTYTQVAETASGKRIRVRVGPFATRADADKVVAKTRAAGLPAAVLTL